MVLLARFLMNLVCAAYDCDPPSPITSSRSLKYEQPLFGKTFKPEPFVTTQSGTVEGYFMRIINGREIYAFEGIPYAEYISVQENRFRDPIPKSPWSGIRSAKKPGPDCLQLNLPRLLRVVGRENCLFLNIYTPQIPDERLSTNKKYPVMIFIPGGNFFYGAGREYGPGILLQEDIILVTINYRLSVFGFLSTGDEESPGNWGLKDTSLAIQWISENIEFFGGNSRNITLSGQSAGGILVHLQMMAKNNIARDLFTRAVSFSSSAFHRWGLQTPKYARQMTENISKAVGCPTNQGSKALIKCLRGVDGNFLAAAQRKLHVTSIFPLMLFAPSFEPANVTGAMIVQSPKNAYKNGQVMKIPYISTNTAQESNFIFMALDNLALTNYYIRNWRPLLPFLYDYGRYVDDPKVATEALAVAYFGRENIYDNGLRMNRTILQELGSDSYFTYANRQTLRAHSKIAPTYSYNYEFTSETSMATSLFQDYRKHPATHTDDLTLFFNSSN